MLKTELKDIMAGNSHNHSLNNVDLHEDFSILDKSKLERDLQCMICSKLLNVPPIFHNDCLGNICGRCCGAAREASGNTKRQQTFELLAQNLTYPCSNKKYGCKMVLKWSEVETHEKSCSYQCSSCPFHYTQYFNKTCNWAGNIRQLNEHIENTHKDSILDPPQLTVKDNKENSIFFTHLGAQLITVIIKYDSDQKYHCLLLFHGNDLESQCYRYQLELCDDSKLNSLIIRKNRLEPLGNMLDALLSPEKMLEVDLMKIKQMLQNTKVVVAKFGIVRKHKKEVIQITGSADSDVLKQTVTKEIIPSPDEEMLVELECPVCQEYMISPIYICQTGHSVCNECKMKVATCPSCRCTYTGARNFTLEKLTLRVNYPCRNREIGCCFVSTSDRIRQHESCCELSETPCILRCGWTGLCPGMYNHLLEKHPTSLVQNGETMMRDIRNEKKTTYHILYVMGELFRLSIKNGPPVKFNLQHLGMVEGEPKFKYQVQFVDQSPLGLNMSLTNPCQVMLEALNEALKTCINVPMEMVKLFITEDRFFYFKITVTKI